ncbi:hypothetical protein, partial [Campylobacter coli]|uniref:hypothetical protein n=1 Tax=Campylobacter coli TaxID=195 RepID=UPI00196A23FB
IIFVSIKLTSLLGGKLTLKGCSPLASTFYNYTKNKLFNFLKQSMKRFYFLFFSTLFFAPSFLFGANIENIKKYRNSIERREV